MHKLYTILKSISTNDKSSIQISLSVRYMVIIKSRKTLDAKNSRTKIDIVIKFKYLICLGLSN